MSTYDRDRNIKGLLIPVDYNDPIIRIEGGFQSVLKRAGIGYAERVSTQNGHDHGFVTVVDEDGVAKRMRLNLRGKKISGYPGQLYGPVLLFSERFIDDGMDFADLDVDRVWNWLQAELRRP